MMEDGLNTLKYTVESVETKRTMTMVHVRIDQEAVLKVK